MIFTGMPRALRRTVTAIAIAPLLAAIPVSAADAAAGSATKTVSYLGHTFTVPASWTVVNLASAPSTCVRFDQNAVYLGTPGTAQNCPTNLSGRTDALLIQSTSGVAGGVADGATDDTAAHQVVSSGGGVTVTGTYGSSPQLELNAISSAGLPVPSTSTSTSASAGTPAATPSASTNAATPATTRVQAAVSSGAKTATTQVATVSSSAVNFTGEAVDTCADPSPSELSSWSSSPFRGVGMYIGGANMACAEPNFTAAAVASDIADGWHLYLLYVGLQAPTNTCGCATFTSPAAQGAAAAEDAVVQARNAGFGPGTPIFYDMETYTASGTVTSEVLTYLSAWTQQLHAEGYASGVYSSVSPGITDLIDNPGSETAPDAIDFADWNGQATTSDSSIPSTVWPSHERIHQYSGATNLSYGGVSIQVDEDYMDIQGFTAAVTTTAPTGTHETSQVVAQNSGTVDLMYQGTNSEVGHMWHGAGGSWAGPQYFAGDAPLSQPSTVTTTTGNVTTFWEGAGGTLWSTWYAPGRTWATPYQITAYSGLDSRPYAVAQANGQMELFWTDSSGELWAGQFTGTSWSAAVNLEGTVASGTAPAPVVSSPGTTEVFFEGTDGTLWNAGTTDYGSTWATATDIGASWGQLAGGPGATGHSDGDLDVFWACGASSNLCGVQYTASASSAWGTMMNLGGTVEPGTVPAPVVSADQTTDVFFEGPSDNLWHVYSTDYGQTWAGPADLGMGGITQPMATAEANGTVIVLWKGSNNSGIWQDSYVPGNSWPTSALEVGGSEA